MKFTPLPRVRTLKPPALIAAGLTSLYVWSEHGCEVSHTPQEARRILSHYQDYAVYSIAPFFTVRSASGPEGWELIRWQHSYVSQQLDGTVVMPTRHIFDKVHPSIAFAELCRVRDFLAAHNVSLGSWSSIARQLWRSTLTKPIALSSQIGREGLYGARKQVASYARHGTFYDVYYCDIRSAYPSAMGSAEYPIRLRKARKAVLNHDNNGVGRASIYVPAFQWWQPLPSRLRHGLVTWQDGTLEGWWPLRELRMAQDIGCMVRLQEVWEPTRTYDLFSDWQSIIIEARQLGGAAGHMLKGIANSLWGTFAMTGIAKIITLGADGKPVNIRLANRKPPPLTAAYIATETSGRVRERLFREGLYKETLYCDTDGIMVRDAKIPTGCVDTEYAAPGDWRVAQRMKEVYIRGPQAYRYTDYDDNETVVLAGMANASRQDLARIVPHADFVMAAKRRVDRDTEEWL